MSIVSNILMTYRADTSQAKQAVKELAGEQKKAAQDELKNLDAKNAKYEGQIKALGKVTVAFGAIAVAGKIAFEAIEFSGRRADLTAAAGAVSIDRLRKATLGLRTDTQLLELAGKLNHAQLKLTQEQMDLAGRAATALAERGGDAEEAFDAVTTALVTGRTRGLAPFGIQIDETKDKAAKFTDLMRALTKVQGEVSESTLDASDKIGQQKVKFANVFDSVTDGIGKVAVELLPLVELLADMGGAIGGTLGAVGKIAKYGIPVYGQVLLVRDAVQGNVFDIAKGYTAGNADYLAQWNAGLALGGMGRVKGGGSSEIEMPAAYVGSDAKKKRRGGGSDPYADARDRADEDSNMAQDWADAAAREQSTYDDLTDQEFGGGASIAEGIAKHRNELLAEAHERMQAMYQIADNGPSITERLFGQVAEIDAYREAWGALTGAVGAGYDAMVDGTMSFGEAAKKSAADALKAIGKKALIRGAEEIAEGFGSLARYDYPGAGNHFLSAAKFGIVAAGAGLAASSLGGSSGASGGAGAKAPDSRGSSSLGGGSQGQSERIIVYEDAFAENNAHERALRAERIVRKVTGSGAVRAR